MRKKLELAIYVSDFDLSKYSSEKPTSVEIVPESLLTVNNYPNPFNPTTTIEFSLPEPGQAHLDVYAMSGQKIRNLTSGYMTAGVHSAVWDGRDDNGISVSSGVYFSRVSVGEVTSSRTMMLVK